MLFMMLLYNQCYTKKNVKQNKIRQKRKKELGFVFGSAVGGITNRTDFAKSLLLQIFSCYQPIIDKLPIFSCY